jgi:ABC-type antimicrobial peptide transport system permease subunit
MRKHWIENLAFYGMAVLAMIGIIAIVLAFYAATGGYHYMEDPFYVFYLIGLYIFGCILASVSFGMLGDKAKGGFWLSLPASHAEKLITVILFTTVAFFVVYSVCFFALKSVAVAFIENRVAENPDLYHFQRTRWTGPTETDGFGFPFKMFMYGFFALQALFLMGSAYFSKYAFIKTIIIAALVILTFAWYTYNLGEWLSENNRNVNFKYQPSKTTIDTFLWIVKLIWAPIFWTVTWFRLKEKEL